MVPYPSPPRTALPSCARAADIWSNCGTASDTLQNIQISVTPNPPKKGQDVSVSFSGNLRA